ncbi:hypothetical protein IFR04_000277 [Cadophora malorum]|uniref:Uncharacterized protein n=1 Tax=Cadophora malorum TaxID=108018 RepID=A0A8H8BWQ8_9HELO|nr:hypothetical protein IFR04_000277 [Cadophora malorum]
MATSERISFDEDDQRPYVSTYANKPDFHVGDKVYLLSGGARGGPYVIASVNSRKYTLSLENGEAVRNGEEIEVDYLEAA